MRLLKNASSATNQSPAKNRDRILTVIRLVYQPMCNELDQVDLIVGRIITTRIGKVAILDVGKVRMRSLVIQTPAASPLARTRLTIRMPDYLRI